MITIKAVNKKMNKWQVLNKYGVVIATFKELYQAVDFVVNQKYKLN